jgi:hypothetical protein
MLKYNRRFMLIFCKKTKECGKPVRWENREIRKSRITLVQDSVSGSPKNELGGKDFLSL